MRRRNWLGAALAGAALLIGAGGPAQTPASPVWLDQGSDWGPEKRADYYTRDQGSQIMPLAWMRALVRADGTRFVPDGLTRYGYLANPGDADGLPVGFVAAGPAGAQHLGMTCAACHTREIEVGGTLYRADGGPAIVDFQAFLTDLDVAVGKVLASQPAFDAFAREVRASAGAAAGEPSKLRADVGLWYTRYHTLMTRALPAEGWGVGRLDAVSMIFNRVAGLDIGPPPSLLIADNIARADAPVRYPFIWNAPRQDHTQWPGFAKNGDDLFALTRNLGEVYGVFARFAPHKSGEFLLGYDYITDNSANFDGLDHLEGLVRAMKEPRWPWEIKPALRDAGAKIFARPIAQGGCAECHGVRPGALRLLPPSSTWKTPIMDVGTDSRQYHVLGRTVSTGALEGALKPSLAPLKANDRVFDVLATSVIGTILQQQVAFLHRRPAGSAVSPLVLAAAKPVTSEVNSAFELPPGAVTATPGPHRYEARVLRGIWATAPYLHNGSVRSLEELLMPAAARTPTFRVGRRYDIKAVGLAADQPGLSGDRVTTGCDQPDSGNSRCGHEYGTHLKPEEKLALLEYLKSL